MRYRNIFMEHAFLCAPHNLFLSISVFLVVITCSYGRFSHFPANLVYFRAYIFDVTGVRVAEQFVIFLFNTRRASKGPVHSYIRISTLHLTRRLEGNRKIQIGP
jgi:hypothetical protein